MRKVWDERLAVLSNLQMVFDIAALSKEEGERVRLFDTV